MSFAYTEHENCFAGHPGKVALPFDDASAHDLVSFKRRLGLAEHVEHVCDQIAASRLLNPGSVKVQWFVGAALDKVLREDPRFSLENRAEALITLAAAELHRQPAQPLAKVIEVSKQRFDRIDAFTRTPEELKACSNALGAMIAATRSDIAPDKVVDETVIRMLDGLERYAPTSKEAATIEPAATASSSAASPSRVANLSLDDGGKS